ncbi:hypothetical protein [Asticcacaulis sp. W401b]|uniref:hypothetical protein n=1 Tax=Asticcacaulis sp. W401b TaxID=3388666 RepID=UPI003970FDFA
MRNRAGRWGWAVAVALALHALAALMVVWLTPAPSAPEPPPVEVELWPMPVMDRPQPQAEAVPAPRPTEPTPRRSLPTPTQPAPRTPETQTPPWVIERPSAPPAATETGSGVTPRAYPEGGDAGRAAATRALNKRQFCIQQRNEGRPMDKDCPVSASKEVVLPLKPPETRPTQLCLAAREREWQKYREGRGAYPGLRDMVSGKKKCRQGWDD